MHDLYMVLLVSGVSGLISPRLGWFTLCIGMGLTLMRGA